MRLPCSWLCVNASMCESSVCGENLYSLNMPSSHTHSIANIISPQISTQKFFYTQISRGISPKIIRKKLVKTTCWLYVVSGLIFTVRNDYVDDNPINMPSWRFCFLTDLMMMMMVAMVVGGRLLNCLAR